jgi:8-hydroxy-5-deazaflavin:NADPH oxidoreductase
MQIGIIGAGGMGTALAQNLVRLGHRVSLASARGPEALAPLAAAFGARAASVDDAVSGAELAILAIPTRASSELPRAAFARSRAIVDLGNYHPELRDGRIAAIEEGLLDSEWVAQQIGGPVVKAFNNIFAESLRTKGRPPGSTGRVALPVAGDPPEARALVLRLVDELGFDAIDAGALRDSWRQATGTPAYCKDLDAVALRHALAAAQRERVAAYRAAEEARIRAALSSGR